MKLENSEDSLDQFLAQHPECREVLACLDMEASRDGTSTMTELCRERGLDLSTLRRLLQAFKAAGKLRETPPVELMTLTEICEHLKAIAHCRLRFQLRHCESALLKAGSSPDDPGHPLRPIQDKLAALSSILSQHLQEEEALFPLIRAWEAGEGSCGQNAQVLKSAALQMQGEHNSAEEALAVLQEWTEEGRGPAGGKTPLLSEFRSALSDLERQLHEQIYIENQLFFPRVLSLVRGDGLSPEIRLQES